MSSRHMKLDEIKARAEASFEKSEQRKREAMQAWKAQEDEGQQVRLKTERLRALRLARDAEEAQAKAAAPVAIKPAAKKTVRRVAKA
ncbi:MAG: hypothetical protein DI527_04410 [Chelatococcus sp.]|nr:MAG: hypothetical protein DI527_04410 [Chelatococcus sp.]